MDAMKKLTQDTKNLSTEAAKEASAYLKIFSEKYIKSSVTEQLKDHIMNTLTENWNKAGSKKEEEEKQQEIGDGDKKENDEEPKEEEKKEDDDKKEDGDKDKEKSKDDDDDKKEEKPKDEEAAKDDDDDNKDKPKEGDDDKDKLKEKEEQKETEEADGDKDKDEPKDDGDKKEEKPKDEEAKQDEDKDDDADKEKKEKTETTEEADKDKDDEIKYPKLDKKGTGQKDENEEKKESKEKDDEKEEEKENALNLPLIFSKVIGYKNDLTDGGGNKYDGYDILYYKLSINDDDPSQFGIKNARYRRLNEFNKNLKNSIKDNKNWPTFPGKKVFKSHNKEFLDEREKEFDAYFVSCSKNKKINQNDKFQYFLGLKQDPTKIKRMKIFRNALLSTSSSIENGYIPSNAELNRFDKEQDMLLYSVMMTVKEKLKTQIEAAIPNEPEKMKKTAEDKINQTMAKAVQSVVDAQWMIIEPLRKQINKTLKEILNEKTEPFNKSIINIMDTIKPIIEKKLKKKKDDDSKDEDDDDDDDDDEEEEKQDNDDKNKKDVYEELKVEDIKSLNEFINKLNGDDGTDASYQKYLDSTLKILEDKENKEKITEYLYGLFTSSYGKYIKKIIKSYGVYEKGTKLICEATTDLIQISFKLTSDNLSLIFKLMDEKKDKKEADDLIKSLQEIAENISNIIGAEETALCKKLRSVDANATALILQEPSVLTGIIGNLLTNLVYQYYENRDLKESLTNNLNKYLTLFCKELLDRLYKSVVSLLLIEIKKEIKEDVDKLFDNLQFDFIPDEMKGNVATNVCQTVLTQLTSFILKKKMKKQQKTLNGGFYKVIRSN